MAERPTNLYTLKQLLPVAEAGKFAVGSFTARYPRMIPAILHAGEATHSPVIVQISPIEMRWNQFTTAAFAREFFLQWEHLRPTVPVGLHLDHTSDFELIRAAVEAGFTSVMIDASALSLEENIAETRKVVDFAHPHGVSVEAELGRIGTGDFMETESDEELYTDPREAGYFVQQTGVDALAVSVGTAHGVYQVRQPKIDLARLIAIRRQTPVSLVLHGGSGTPLGMVHDAIRLPGGGVSKVNFATDLELALFAVLALKDRITDASLRAYPPRVLERGMHAVRQVVEEKITTFLASDGHAGDYRKE